MNEGIVVDARQVRETNNNADIDISSFIQKHIHVGSHQETIQKQLQKEGFTLYDEALKPDGSQTVIAIYKDKGVTGVGFYDEIRVIVEFKNNAVKNSSGRLIFRSL